MATEKRLYDLDEVFKDLDKRIWWTDSEKAAIRNFLIKQKRVDAVEVVRCKDCKHCDVYQSVLDSTTRLICMIHSFELVDPTDYCSKGERKDND